MIKIIKKLDIFQEIYYKVCIDKYRYNCMIFLGSRTLTIRGAPEPRNFCFLGSNYENCDIS